MGYGAAVFNHGERVAAKAPRSSNAPSRALQQLMRIVRAITCQTNQATDIEAVAPFARGRGAESFVPPLPGDSVTRDKLLARSDGGGSRSPSSPLFSVNERGPPSPSISMSRGAAARRRAQRGAMARRSQSDGSIASTASSLRRISPRSCSSATDVPRLEQQQQQQQQQRAVDAVAEAEAMLAPHACRNCSGFFVAGGAASDDAGAHSRGFCSGECAWSASIQRSDRRNESRRQRAAENDSYFLSAAYASDASSTTSGMRGARTMSDLMS